MNEGTQGEDSPQKRHEGPAGFEGLRSLVTDLNVQRSERTGDQASPGKGALADHDTEEEVRSRRENTGPVAQRRPTAAKRALGGQNVVRPKRWDERTGQGGVERTQPAAKMPEPRAKHEVDEPRRHPISGIPIERRSRDTLTPKLVGTALAIAAVMGIAIHFWLSEEEIAFEEPPAGGVQELTLPQLRWCAREKMIRDYLMRDQPQSDEYVATADQYARRCAEKPYRRDLHERAVSELHEHLRKKYAGLERAKD